MFVPFFRFADQHLIAGPEPPAVGVVDKGLGIGFLVLEVAQDHRRRLHVKFTPALVACHFIAVEVDDLGLGSG